MEIVDLTHICRSFPESSGIQVPRDNVLQILETLLDGDVQLISVEGQEGIGKTTLLAQFAKRHGDVCFSLFINPTSRFAYDPELLLTDLCDQISWRISGHEVAPEGGANDAIYRQLILEAQRLSNRFRRKFYFIVDGLEEIPGGGPQPEDILSLIPLGLPQFRVLVSGTTEKLLSRTSPKIRQKAVPIPFFSLDETTRFFGENLSMPNEAVQEFHKASKGVPSNLAAIRRILDAGTAASDLLDELPTTLPSLFDYEWRLVDSANELQLDILATLAHDRRRHTVSGLAALFDKEPNAVRTLLDGLTFIVVPSQDDEQIQFVSESFRSFAGTHLSSRKESVQSKLIDYLLDQPDTKDALTYLPTYLQETGRLDDLLEFLSPEHFARLMGTSQSLTPVDQKAQLGLEAALRLERDGDILRFGLERTVIADVDDCAILESEVEARLALDDYGASVAVAESAVLKQDRLRLLARIVKLQREKGLVPEIQLLEQITQLFEEVEVSSFKGNVSTLATDLMYCKPDLAIQLVKKVAAERPESESDWTLIRLSLVASLSEGSAASDLAQAAEKVRLHIKNRALLGFSAALPLLVGNYSASEVLREVAKLEDPKDQLLLIRIWASNTNRPEQAGDIIEHALRLGIQTLEYTPVATDLRRLARPVPFLSDVEQMRRLVGVIDTQKATVEKLGPTEDYVRLQLELAHAETRYDHEAATRRLLETYYFVSDIKDLEVSTACTARLVAEIPHLDPNFKLADSEEILHAATKEFGTRLQALLAATADHYLSTRNVIRALAKRRPSMAFSVVKSLNTEPRRDSALSDLISAAGDQEVDRIPLDDISRWIEEFADPESYDDGLSDLFDSLARRASDDLGGIVGQVVRFIQPIKGIHQADVRCKACLDAITILAKSGSAEMHNHLPGLQEILKDAWQRIGDDRTMVETGYRISSAFAPYFREDAARYLSQVDELRRTRTADSPVLSYPMCVRVAVRAFSGLLAGRFDSPDDFDQLARQIQRIGSESSRAWFWTHVALEYARSSRLDDARRIVSERIKPLLEQIRARDKWEWQEAVARCAPALYQAHKTTALEVIDQLDMRKRDEAVDRTIDFILKKIAGREPYEAKGVSRRFKLTYEEAVDICELLDHVDEDTVLYSYITKVVDSILWKINRSSFSEQQRADLAQALGKLIARKLPNSRFIKHDGFKIVAEAQISRLGKARPNPNEQIDAISQKIDNPADRAFILSAVATSDTKLDLDLRKRFFKKAKTCADDICSTLDRANRYWELAEGAADVDRSLSKECVREAFGLLPRTDDSEVSSLKTDIVNFAHQIDPELAASLAASLDNDPARKQVRAKIAVEELSKNIADRKAGDLSKQEDALPRAAWSLLGKLNANRIEPLPVSETRRFIQMASSMPLSKAYPIISWVIENAIRRRSQSAEARRLLHNLHSAALVACELSFRLGPQGMRKPTRIANRTATEAEKGLIVHSGQRQQALEFLRNWLIETAREYVKICDPYFGPADLEALRLILGSNPGLRISILSSRKHQDSECAGRAVDDEYRARWGEISDQAPPDTEVVIVGNRTGELPIHDRWWLTRNGGLRTGSSFSSLGGRRESEITFLSKNEAQRREAEVDEFLNMQKREHEGEKLSIYVFAL